MKKNLISWQLMVLALIGGLWIAFWFKTVMNLGIAEQIIIGGMVALLSYWAGLYLTKMLSRWIKVFNRWLDNISIEILICGTVGLVLGVLVGLLSSYPFSMIRGAGTYLTIVCFLLCSCLGIYIGSRRATDVWQLLPHHSVGDHKKIEEQGGYKVLDTSAIIDGRIYDVCQSKFLDGTLLVSGFVIEELQHIADSSDNLRRSKGRRGLELLSKMQKDPSTRFQIIEDTVPEEKEVDMKLVRLCKNINASIITNDYNLNKVAELQGIRVLNINELTNAVKVVVYPGETMYINILKEGKEPGQGVGYLEDGTMVVVEDAHDELGNNLEVMVTSVFQTAAGRMIFSRKVKEEHSLGIFKPDLPGEPAQEVNLYG